MTRITSISASSSCALFDDVVTGACAVTVTVRRPEEGPARPEAVRRPEGSRQPPSITSMTLRSGFSDHTSGTSVSDELGDAARVDAHAAERGDPPGDAGQAAQQALGVHVSDHLQVPAGPRDPVSSRSPTTAGRLRRHGPGSDRARAGSLRCAPCRPRRGTPPARAASGRRWRRRPGLRRRTRAAAPGRRRRAAPRSRLDCTACVRYAGASGAGRVPEPPVTDISSAVEQLFAVAFSSGTPSTHRPAWNRVPCGSALVTVYDSVTTPPGAMGPGRTPSCSTESAGDTSPSCDPKSRARPVSAGARPTFSTVNDSVCPGPPDGTSTLGGEAVRTTRSGNPRAAP